MRDRAGELGEASSVEVSLFVSGLSLYLKHVCVVDGGGKQAEGRTCYGGVKRKMKEVTYMF